MKNQKKKKKEFSKGLLVQESILLWITTIALIILAFICIFNDFTGELPWIGAMTAFPWSAYAVSQMYYYKKSCKENTKGGIKYESVMADIQAMKNNDPYGFSSEENSEENEE